MDWRPASTIRWLCDSERGASDRLIPRWLFLRALGVIYFSAFYSLIFQIRGLIGPAGILPASEYLQAVTESVGHARYWYAPTLVWFSSSSEVLSGLCWVGMAAAILLVFNLWPRGMLAICFVCFLSFVSAAGEFSGYQSDGMLLEAGFIALFLAPGGLRRGLAENRPPIRAALFLLQWECFRIYFESGVAKIASGDPEWRHFTAMDEYYQNGPLPTWIGWYVDHLPHWFHAATASGTLALELILIWMTFLPRPVRIVLFFILTPWQIGIALTANYTFLNYLVLALGILLLDDRILVRFVSARWRKPLLDRITASIQAVSAPRIADSLSILQAVTNDGAFTRKSEEKGKRTWRMLAARQLSVMRLAVTAVVLGWIFYSTTAQMVWMIAPGFPLSTSPVAILDPFRIANRYGLFAVMTRGRYEIEFQGSEDGQAWVVYPFRYKPQDPSKPPRVYAPYQPRFDWNLWFASLSSWRQEPIVVRTEESLLRGNTEVLLLFAGNPFPHAPPRQVRVVVWQYWFTTPAEKRSQGLWWRRQQLGLYAPTLERESDGRVVVLEWPPAMEPRE